MNKNTFQLLKDIISNNGKPLSIESLAKSYNVVPRTFYNYWSDISFYLQQLGIPDCISFNGKEFILNSSQETTLFLLNSMNSMSFVEYKLSSEEREYLIEIMLLASDVPILGSSFSDIFETSRNTISSDIQKVKLFFEEQNIYISDFKHKGLILTCEESIRRVLIVKLLKENNIVQDYFINSIPDPTCAYITRYLKFERYHSIIEHAIKLSEEKLNIELNDRIFYTIETILLITLFRNENNNSINEFKFANNTYIKEHIIALSQDIFNNLNLLLSKNENELNFFIYELSYFDIATNVSINLDNSTLIPIVVKELLIAFSHYYHIDLTKDKTLVEYLNAHILACYNRVKRNQSIDNPYLSEIQNKYQQDFQELKKNIYIIENSLNISLNDGEIAYILMHILASLERSEIHNNITKIIIVCHTGIATGNFLATQIKKYFRVEVCDICSIHNAEKAASENNAELIISTVPILNSSFPVIVTGAVLSNLDMQELQKVLSSIQTAKEFNTANTETTNDESFLKLFSEDTIRLNVECSDWQNAIITAAELLLWKKMITVNYMQQMIDLINQYGPYIVIAPGIALAHASPNDGALISGVSIIRLKKAIKFHKENYDPIDVVIGCSIQDSIENTNDLLRLMRILLKPNFLRLIKKANNANDVIEVIKKLM